MSAKRQGHISLVLHECTKEKMSMAARLFWLFLLVICFALHSHFVPYLVYKRISRTTPLNLLSQLRINIFHWSAFVSSVVFAAAQNTQPMSFKCHALLAFPLGEISFGTGSCALPLSSSKPLEMQAKWVRMSPPTPGLPWGNEWTALKIRGCEIASPKVTQN